MSALAPLPAGFAGSLSGGNTADAVAGAQAVKTTVDNNAFSLGTGMTSIGAAN
ncbi:VENN motif pre-toxin domain-containing protein [Pantoea sp. T14]|uniref:VENN motif pre-toxin domain-containing protein n=1 Tax=Pantoea sp. T14 TaxID=3085685 RepID=UPI001FAA0BF3